MDQGRVDAILEFDDGTTQEARLVSCFYFPSNDPRTDKEIHQEMIADGTIELVEVAPGVQVEVID